MPCSGCLGDHLSSLSAGARVHAVGTAASPAGEAAAGRALALGHESAALGARVEAAATGARAASGSVDGGTPLLDEDVLVADLVGIGSDRAVKAGEGGKLDEGGILDD
jgi:hypothetical protein